MDLTKAKELLISGREIVLNIATALSKVFPFPAENIKVVIILALSFFLANLLINLIPMKNKFVIKLIATAGIFYLLNFYGK